MCHLAHTARDIPVLVAALNSAPAENIDALSAAGVEVLRCPADNDSKHVDLAAVLRELGRRSMTNVLVEGGGGLLGCLFDRQLVDETHVFIAPKFCGGADAVPPIGGAGVETIPQHPELDPCVITQVEQDVYIRGHIRRTL